MIAVGAALLALLGALRLYLGPWRFRALWPWSGDTDLGWDSEDEGEAAVEAAHRGESARKKLQLQQLVPAPLPGRPFPTYHFAASVAPSPGPRVRRGKRPAPGGRPQPTRRRARQRGLRNSGNACFANATLQLLGCSALFCDALVDGVARAGAVGAAAPPRWWALLAAAPPKQAPVRVAVAELSRLLADLRQGGSALPADPSAFLRAASRLTPVVSGFSLAQRQEDAGELLLAVLDWVQSVVGRPAPPPDPAAEERLRAALGAAASADDSGTYLHTVEQLAAVAAGAPVLSDAPTADELFVGQLARGTKCGACAALSVRHQPLRLLAVPVSQVAEAPAVGVAEAVAAQFASEAVPDVLCSRCGARATAESQSLLQRAPVLLAVQLSRFGMTLDGRPTKHRARVTLSRDAVPLGPLLLQQSPGAGAYSLCGVVCHWGASISSGHYVTFRPAAASAASSEDGGEQEWLCFDDEVVTRLSWAQVQEATERDAYLLLFSQV